MNLCKQYKPQAGYTPIVERGEMGLIQLDFGILQLNRGKSFFENTADNEVILIVLSGRCTLLVGHNGNKAYGIIGERENVFDGEPYRAYIPFRTTYELFADEQPVEVAICKAPSDRETAAIIVEPGDGISEQDLAHSMTVSERPIYAIAGEAICFYRFNSPEDHASQHVYSHDRSFDQMISMSENTVLSLPVGYYSERMGSAGKLYCLWLAVKDVNGRSSCA